MKTKTSTPVFFILVIILSFFSCARQEDSRRIYPLVKSFETGSGKHILGKDLVIENHGFADPSFVSAYLTQKLGMHAINLLEGRKSIFRLQKDSLMEEKAGAYHLEIRKNEIVIRARDEQGVFYAVTSLLQLTENQGNKSFLPCVSISDYPEFEWRGMHLDVARHFFPVEFIKKYIDILALHKLNVFHWHLTDDQGWRMEMEKYPLLTARGAWRKDRRELPWSYELEFTKASDPEAYGGYYTQVEIREIVKYAAERFITIVPEIEMPGHSQAALYAFPGLSCSGIPWKKPDNVPFEFSDPFCAGNDSVFIFLKDVLWEVMELFPSEYIHIGGDEAKKTPWENCPKCRKRMKENGLTDSGELQAWFMEEIDGFLRQNQRKSIGWNEIMEGNISKEAAIMAWTGENISLEAMEKGYRTVSAESRYYYFNRPHEEDMENNGELVFLRQTYEHNPLPPGAGPDLKDRFMGVNACLWSEDVQTGAQAEIQLLPRLAAFAETGWSDPAMKNFSSFTDGLLSYFKFLDQENIQYYIPAPAGLKDDLFYGDSYEMVLSAPYQGMEIRYSLDGTIPDLESSLYTSPVLIRENSTVKAACFIPGGKSGKAAEARIKTTELKDGSELETAENGCLMKWAYQEISGLDEADWNQLSESETLAEISIPGYLAGKDHFIMLFNSFIRIEEDGIYSFSISSDDGSRLYLDGELLADNDGVHGPVWVTGQTGLKKGFHSLKIEFFEAAYGESLEIKFGKQGEELKKIEKELLFLPPEK